MSETVTLAAEPRTGSGSHAAATLRKLGRVPAIIYGHKEPVVAISISADDLRRAIMVQHARVLDLTVSGKTEKVLIRELQWDHLGDIMLHADFTRISQDEKVKVTVPVKLKNTPKNNTDHSTRARVQRHTSRFQPSRVRERTWASSAHLQSWRRA